jgi:hypothetical protein
MGRGGFRQDNDFAALVETIRFVKQELERKWPLWKERVWREVIFFEERLAGELEIVISRSRSRAEKPVRSMERKRRSS